MTCHRCKKSIASDERGTFYFFVKGQTLVNMDAIPRYHDRCLPPQLYWRTPDGRDRQERAMQRLAADRWQIGGSLTWKAHEDKVRRFRNSFPRS